jgi:hypothetical protein
VIQPGQRFPTGPGRDGAGREGTTGFGERNEARRPEGVPGLAGTVPPYAIDSVSIPSGADIVAYDSDPNELVSTRVAGELLQKGLKVRVLKGGVPEWLAANFPIETKDAPRSAPPEPGSLSKG